MKEEINYVFWNKLIEEHYLSCIKRNPNYKLNREENREYWYKKINNINNNPRTALIIETIINASIISNNENRPFYPA